MPVEGSFKTLNVYEQGQVYFPEYQTLKFKDTILNTEIDKVSLENLYIDSHFDVYPLNCIETDYKLGNIKDGLIDLVEVLNNRQLLPDLVKQRLDTEFDDLFKWVDPVSKDMHTPQTLFEKLIRKHKC